MKLLLVLASIITLGHTIQAQDQRWQQRVEYKMDVKLDVKNHRFSGIQNLTYHNNSPDTLGRVFYHLYFNAFQPGSMMDIRSSTIEDPDPRVGNRISKLKDGEYGRLNVSTLRQDNKTIEFREVGTILEVILAEPVLPGKSTQLDMEFTGQVPIQIRRSGRDSREGIAYSMSQWYPKLCEYDYMGWHANPYIAREFHGVWGSFDVKLMLDAKYTVGGTGYLQNPNEVGHGYQDPGVKVKSSKGDLTWHFKADNVHDFMWAADPDYTHIKAKVPEGPTLHFFYQKSEKTEKSWSQLPEFTVKAFQYMNKQFGKYPYEQFSVVQGGDGGMEYPMSTLVTGERSLSSLVGVTVHELIHSWFQGVLAFNESLYPWMDEGFTSYATDRTMRHLFDPSGRQIPHKGAYGGYFYNAQSGKEEPLTTHADHYLTNTSYGINAYNKGSVFLHQLSYIIGEEIMMKGMRRFFNAWKFQHPNPNDFIRIMEKTSGIQLRWYLEHWMNTTNQIDYGIRSITAKGRNTIVKLERAGNMMMPVDLEVELKSGSKRLYYIPLRMMRGAKQPSDNIKWIELESWPWVEPVYELTIDVAIDDIKRIEIDPSRRMADVDRDNNKLYRTGALVYPMVPKRK